MTRNPSEWLAWYGLLSAPARTTGGDCSPNSVSILIHPERVGTHKRALEMGNDGRLEEDEHT